MSAILNAIFLTHRRSLLSSVLRIVRDSQTAEDLAQETYIRARQALDARPIEHIESFLFRTARNLAIDHQRRKTVRAKYEARDAGNQDVENVALDSASAEDKLAERQLQRLFEETLETLPLRARTAWALLQLHGWTYAEIADHMGVSRNTIYNDIKLVVRHCQDTLARSERL